MKTLVLWLLGARNQQSNEIMAETLPEGRGLLPSGLHPLRARPQGSAAEKEKLLKEDTGHPTWLLFSPERET